MVVASRRITNTRTKNWRIILKVWNSNLLWVPCLIHINTFVNIHRHTYTTLQHVSPKIKTKRVCYNLPVVRAFIVHFLTAFLSSISLLAKLPWLRKLFTVFVIIRQDRVFFLEVPDSIILYYDSGCWYNTVSVEKYCNSFHWIYLLVTRPAKSWRSLAQNRSR